MVVLVMARTRYARWAGGTGSGSREYTPGEYQRVVSFMANLAGSTTYEQVAQATGVGGRTVRAVLSAADGVVFVLSIEGDGVSLATSQDEAEHATRRLHSQARAMVERAERREAWAAQHLPRWQQRMFDEA